jgi:predicted alpha/beta-fold hydrolase
MHLTEAIFAADPSDDLSIAFDQFIQWRIKRMYLVGLSVGGWASLFTLSQLKQSTKKYITGAVAVSPPANLIGTWKHVEKNRLYNWLLFQTYKNMVNRRMKIDRPDKWDKQALKKSKSIRQFAEIFFPFRGCNTINFTQV